MQIEQKPQRRPALPPQRLCSGHGKDRSRHHGRAMRAFCRSYGSQGRYRGDQFLGALFSAVLYGSLGFYLGTNIPSMSSSRTFSSTGSGPKTIARWQAPSAHSSPGRSARLGPYDHLRRTPPAMWNVGIGSGWALGVLLQLAAGTARAWTIQQRPWLGREKTSSWIEVTALSLSNSGSSLSVS